MANPSLKAKIEAAKSALEEDQNNTPLNQERDDAIAPKTVLKPSPDFEQTSPIQLKHQPTLNQMPLHLMRASPALRVKWRKISVTYTRYLVKSGKSPAFKTTLQRAMDQEIQEPKNINSDEKNATRHQSRRIAITLAVLAGIILGIGFFFASDFIDQHLVHLHTWAMQFVDFISDIVR